MLTLVLGVTKSNKGGLPWWFWVLLARHSFRHKFDGVEVPKVSRFLVCSRNTESQVTRDISEILDRSWKARTKETPSRDRIQPAVSVGNQRKDLLARHSATSAEIQSLLSFVFVVLATRLADERCAQSTFISVLWIRKLFC
jgi:hypothetical protein